MCFKWKFMQSSITVSILLWVLLSVYTIIYFLPGLYTPPHHTWVKSGLQPKPNYPLFWGWGVQICWLFFWIWEFFPKILPAGIFFLGSGAETTEFFFFGKITHVFRDTSPVKKRVGNPFLKEFFDFEEKFFQKNCAVRQEQRKEGTTERGNDWNDTTSVLFKNLVWSFKLNKYNIKIIQFLMFVETVL